MAHKHLLLCQQGYTIHADGKLHCVVRYRQLSCLHDQLKRVFGARALPTFPPKKLLHLNSEEVEERRLLLERYLQLGKGACRRELPTSPVTTAGSPQERHEKPWGGYDEAAWTT